MSKGIKYTIGSENTAVAVISPVASSSLVSTTKTYKNGAVAAKAMNRKDWSLTTGSTLKGRELKRAHNAYLREYINAATGAIAAAIGNGTLGVIAAKVNKNGSIVDAKLVHKASIVDPLESKKAAVKRAEADAKRSTLVDLYKAGSITEDVYKAAILAIG